MTTKHTEARAVLPHDGDHWYLIECLRKEGNNIICRLRSTTRDKYTIRGGSRPLEKIAALDRDAVIRAKLEQAALRSGTLGILLLGEYYPLPRSTADEA